MPFMSATQSTDLDRTDNIRAATVTARRFREETLTRSRALMTDGDLVAASQSGDESATLELIARHEPRIRAIVSEFRAANGAAEPDLQQSAMAGFLAAIGDFVDDGRAEFFTVAFSHIRGECRDANRTMSPLPVPSSQHSRFFEAMRAADNNPEVARRWSALQRLSIAALEMVADSGGQDEHLAREIIDHRVDVYERHVKRGYVGTGRGKGDRTPVPAWEVYREERGRGLMPHEFDTVHAALTYESLDVPHTDGEDDADAYGTTAAEPEATDPYEDAENRIAFDQMLAALDDRERTIVTRHIDGETDREIAEGLGLSRPRVVSIRSAAIARMRTLAEG